MSNLHSQQRITWLQDLHDSNVVPLLETVRDNLAETNVKLDLIPTRPLPKNRSWWITATSTTAIISSSKTQWSTSRRANLVPLYLESFCSKRTKARNIRHKSCKQCNLTLTNRLEIAATRDLVNCHRSHSRMTMRLIHSSAESSQKTESQDRTHRKEHVLTCQKKWHIPRTQSKHCFKARNRWVKRVKSWVLL